MRVTTFMVGGAKKFQDRFIKKINQRLDGEVEIVPVYSLDWDNWGDNKRSIPKSPDLTLVLKSCVNHSLRNWARSQSKEQGILFCECSHKVSIAELDLRHLFGLPAVIRQQDDDLDELGLADLWERESSVPLIWDGQDDPYDAMPWVAEGKQTMLRAWSERSSDYPAKFLRKEYNRLLDWFKGIEEGTVAHEELTQWANAWYERTSLTTFKGDLSKVAYSANMIWARSVSDLNPDTMKRLYQESKPKEETPAPVVEETPAPVVEVTPTPVVEETPAPVVEETPAPVVEETPTDYVLLGGVIFTPSQKTPIFIEEASALSPIEVHGRINVQIGHMTQTTLYNITLTKEA